MPTETDMVPSPDRIMEMLNGFQGSAMLKAGIELGLFTQIGAGTGSVVALGDGYDVVLLTNFLHHFDFETCVSMLSRCFDALAPGGRVVTLEFVPNDDGVSPPQAAMFSMVMLVSTPHGKAYRFSELAAMHEAAGLVDCELFELPPTPQRLVVARKP